MELETLLPGFVYAMPKIVDEMSAPGQLCIVLLS